MKKYAIILRGVNQNVKENSVREIDPFIRTKTGAEGWLRIHSEEKLDSTNFDKVVFIGNWLEVKEWLKKRMIKASDSFFDRDREELRVIPTILEKHKDEEKSIHENKKSPQHKKLVWGAILMLTSAIGLAFGKAMLEDEI